MTTPAPHPIQLELVVFTRSIVIAVPGHVPGPSTKMDGTTNKINIIKLPERQGAYHVTMNAVMNSQMDKAMPYHIDMEALAVLVVDDTLNEADTQRGLYITGHSVLYGAIREAVSWSTSRQIYGPLMLGLSVLQINTSTPPAP